MAIAGTLNATNARLGVSAGEIVSIALGNVGTGWVAGSDLSFVWGVSNLAGLPFFDPRNMTFLLDPTKPMDAAYAVPHAPGIISSTADIAGDGWLSVTSSSSVNTIKSAVQPGDLIMVYAHGNTGEAPTMNGADAAHAMIVTSVVGSQVKVASNWNAPTIYEHDLDDVAQVFAAGGMFNSAFVSRIDQTWVNMNVPETVAGMGEGIFDGIGETSPDLTAVIDTTTPGAIDPGSTTELHYTIANIGDAASEPVVSEITLYEADQNTLISTLQVTDPVIGAGLSTQQIVNFDIPADLGPGDYYFRIQTGRVNNLNDANAANNFSAYYAVTVAEEGEGDLANLRLSNVMLDDSTIMQGQSTTIRYDVINDGDLDAGSTRTGFYVSMDTIFGEGDIFLEYDSVTVGAGMADGEFETLGGLADFAPGNYFIFAVADYADTETESNESDNVAPHQMLTIEPGGTTAMGRDLMASDLSSDAVNFTPGEEVVVRWTITNDGPGVVSGGGSALYLSDDPMVTIGDTFIGALPFAALDADDMEEEIFDFDVPLSLSDGTYYLAAIVDHNEQIDETNEANNTTMPLMFTVSNTTPEPQPVDENVTINHQGSTQDQMVVTQGGDDDIRTGSGADQIMSYAGDDVIDAGDGDDTIHSGRGDDQVYAGAGDDMVLDGFGRDEIDGGAGDDELAALSGVNMIDGADGMDVILGGIGADNIMGGGGADIIIGDISTGFYGNDTITAGSGDDMISGGGGFDRFVFRPADGTNTIAHLEKSTASGPWMAVGQDFMPGLDVIRLEGFTLSSAEAALSQVTVQGGHATLEIEGTEIILYGVNPGDLSTADFEII